MAIDSVLFLHLFGWTFQTIAETVSAVTTNAAFYSLWWWFSLLSPPVWLKTVSSSASFFPALILFLALWLTLWIFLATCLLRLAFCLDLCTCGSSLSLILTHCVIVFPALDSTIAHVLICTVARWLPPNGTAISWSLKCRASLPKSISYISFFCEEVFSQDCACSQWCRYYHHQGTEFLFFQLDLHLGFTTNV